MYEFCGLIVSSKRSILTPFIKNAHPMKEIYAKEKGVFPFVEIRSADVLIFSAFSGKLSTVTLYCCFILYIHDIVGI